jgi:CRP/FNR family transcriptional regulator, cyclic AMP receptor protein
MTTRAELEKVTILRSIEFFSDMHTSHLKKLAAITSEVEFSAGQIIYQEGDADQPVYLVQKGEVVIEMKAPDNTYATVLMVGRGQLFGWSALFPGQRKRARARATKATHAITLDGGRLNQLFQADHKLEHVMMQKMIKLVGDRVYAARQQLLDCTADRQE